MQRRTVIPVCFKCHSPVKIEAEAEAGLELIRYRCTHCQHSSSSFLLGHIDLSDNEMSEIEDSQDLSSRAETFALANKNYRLRAKVQAFIAANSSDTKRRQTGPFSNSSRTHQ